MMYRCRHCKHTEGRGFLPGVSCGLMSMTFAGVAGGLLLPLVWHFFPKLGWWWILAAPLLVVGSFVGSYIIHELLAGIEWTAFCLRKCPQCGNRKWSWGFTQGFGL